MTKDINLFYDIRNLFNIPEETFRTFYEIRNRIKYNRQVEFGRNILLVYPTRESKERSYNATLARINFTKIDSISIENFDTVYTFAYIGEIIRNGYMEGRQFTDIRFIG